MNHKVFNQQKLLVYSPDMNYSAGNSTALLTPLIWAFKCPALQQLRIEPKILTGAPIFLIHRLSQLIKKDNELDFTVHSVC